MDLSFVWGNVLQIIRQGWGFFGNAIVGWWLIGRENWVIMTLDVTCVDFHARIFTFFSVWSLWFALQQETGDEEENGT